MNKKKTIWKFELQINDLQSITIPAGAKILCVQTQNGAPCIWVLVDENNDKEERHFRIYGTGHPINNIESQNYIGTFQVNGGVLVFHLFEQY